jgi:uncharacterized protein (TIGR03083 family)
VDEVGPAHREVGPAYREVGPAYRGVRLRVCELVADRDDTALEGFAPATPDWTVHDLLAHLVGVTADIVSGNLDGVGTDAWANAQVDARRGRRVDELLAEWDEHGPVVEEMAAQFGRAAGQLLSDATTHEHDVRGALGAHGARDSSAVALSVGFVGLSLGEQLDQAERGALVVQHGGRSDTLGSGAPAAALRIDDFELLRALTGRRCVEQMAAYDWDGAFSPEHLVLTRFAVRPDPLVE